MQKLPGLFLLGCSLALGTAQAGDELAPRKEFKQSTTYPYVFRPVCYLVTQGPAPLHFAPASPECDNRRPPILPAPTPKKIEEKPAPPPVSTTPAEPAQPVPPPQDPNAAAPAYPPPANAPAPTTLAPRVDFSQFPKELLEAFKQGAQAAEGRNYLFDPIFQPALPDDLPKSKATYIQEK